MSHALTLPVVKVMVHALLFDEVMRTAAARGNLEQAQRGSAINFVLNQGPVINGLLWKCRWPRRKWRMTLTTYFPRTQSISGILSDMVRADQLYLGSYSCMHARFTQLDIDLICRHTWVIMCHFCFLNINMLKKLEGVCRKRGSKNGVRIPFSDPVFYFLMRSTMQYTVTRSREASAWEPCARNLKAIFATWSGTCLYCGSYGVDVAQFWIIEIFALPSCSCKPAGDHKLPRIDSVTATTNPRPNSVCSSLFEMTSGLTLQENVTAASKYLTF